MSLLAIIPARGGSKGLPGKNIRPLCGKPLLAYSIEAARNCQLVDRVVVSTESQQIAEVAIRYGADVPYLRAPELAGDKANLGQVIGDMLWRLANAGEVYDAHIVLVPTSPFRSRGLMDHLCSVLLRGHNNVQAVKPLAGCPLVEQDSEGRLHIIAREDQWPGSAPVFRSYGVFSGHNRLGKLPSYMFPIYDPTVLIDIDDPFDFELAEAVIQGGQFDYNAAGLYHVD
jgi:CMP-N-acetylneuraminic acid synthetase